MFYAKYLPYFAGIPYRGIQMSEENIATLISLVDQRIYFVCFTSTSKNLVRAMMGGNAPFEIQTMTKQEQEECRQQTNADISTVSQCPEGEEVIYASLMTFYLRSITYSDDPNESANYIVKIHEHGSSLFFQLFSDKGRLPNHTPFQSGTDMWESKYDQHYFDVGEHLRSPV
ncbi:unnamed protein product [Didymodactylos carnosus]|uniref:Uncharacterized protein n=1 Tax=Didymodactylos carnosus TaxID=1234261 RepID=A0A815IL03_9BILA|nr:unnamed protein product [Didymodactylos carnosus]CAF1367365.1 unnamed protein product [Didymodactylos carnosus]CAF3817133.1 unnamed protein product [Didymodactylos carnosus]CAF4250463.1 unnamed protein product [Didymodactylos carnosus]